MKPLATERLVLRPLTMDDADALYREIYSDEEVVRWYSGAGVRTLEDVRARVSGSLFAWRESELGRHAVVRRSDDSLLGQVHLNPEISDGVVEVELAFAFGRRYWGHGFAFEACSEMVRYAFDDLGPVRLVNEFDRDNNRSWRLHERLGYRVETGDPRCIAVLDNPQRRSDGGASSKAGTWRLVDPA